MTGYEPQDVRQHTAHSPGGMGDPVTGLSTAEADGRLGSSGTQERTGTAAGQAGQGSQTAKDTASQLSGKAGDMASRAREAATSEQAKPMARRAGGILVIGGAVAALIAWRRRSRRKETPMQKLARKARTRADMTRGQARAARKAAKSASAMATAKAAKGAKSKVGSKGRR